MEDLPTEIQVLISQYLDSQSKLHIRATNTLWRYLCPPDYFKINGATSENLHEIIDTYSKIQRPFGLAFQNFKDITLTDFVDQVTKLTNLTSLKFDRIDDPSPWQNSSTPWVKFQVMTQLTIFKPCPTTIYPLGILANLKNLKELRYSEVDWNNISRRYMDIRIIDHIVTLLTQLESLEFNVLYADNTNPFVNVANPTKITKILLAGRGHHACFNSESLKRFVNLKRFKLEMDLPVEIEHFTALEDLKLIRTGIIDYNFEHNKMLTKLNMKCQTIDDNASATLKHLTNMKKLSLQLTDQNNQIRQNLLLAFLSKMTNLQKFKLNVHELVSGEQFTNLTNLTRLEITAVSAIHNTTFINHLITLKSLVIESQNIEELDLSKCQNLESLDFLGTTSVDILRSISSKKLKRLCCPILLGADYDLLRIQPLRHLQITNYNEEFYLWKTIEQMTSLQKLVLFKMYGYDFKKLLQLIDLTDLRTLEVQNLMKPHKRIPVTYFTKLTSLKELICKGKILYTRQ